MQIPTLLGDLAALVKPQQNPVAIRLGVITSYTPGSINVGLKIGGSTTEVIGRFVNYDPQVGDTVQVIQDGLDPIVIGKAGSTGPGLAVPVGAIVMWGNTLPTSWERCEGQPTTGNAALAAVWGSNVPDLRYRFVMGAGPGVGNGLQGGYETVTLGTTHIPPHVHNLTESTSAAEASGFGLPASGFFTDRPLVDSSSVARSTQATGSATPFDNRPPFYVLTFIIKVSA